ncbi:hypothetical protein [Bacillus sp. MUM 13]|uniref:hypothetical protein n=1 Tax=Bacillus sp. MUM 13 TaxID=1678001 RepID=UPI00147BC07C|nr:hypothetical protein [Bacillus sp. MUM 13]
MNESAVKTYPNQQPAAGNPVLKLTAAVTSQLEGPPDIRLTIGGLSFAVFWFK